MGFVIDKFGIGKTELASRLFIGTEKYSSNDILHKVIISSQSQVVTTALRRVKLDYPKENILNYIYKNCILLPNTSGARNAEEAFRIAKLVKAA